MTTTTAPRFSLYWFASPQTFYPLAGRLIPWFIALATLFTVIGLYIAFVAAPTDATTLVSTISSCCRSVNGMPIICATKSAAIAS